MKFTLTVQEGQHYALTLKPENAADREITTAMLNLGRGAEFKITDGAYMGPNADEAVIWFNPCA